MGDDRELSLDQTQCTVDTDVAATPAAQPVGAQKLQYMLQCGQPTPVEIAAEIQKAQPSERPAMIELLQKTRGNGYVQTVSQELQKLDAAQNGGLAAKPIGDAADPSIKTTATPDASLKQPADKLGSTTNPTYANSDVPIPNAVPADSQVETNGQVGSTTNPISTQTPLGPTTTISGNKTIDTLDVDSFRKNVNAALDEQIKTAKLGKNQDSADLVTQLTAEKAKVAAATTKDELDQIVANNKLLVAPGNKVWNADVTQATSGTSAAGVFDPNTPIAQNNTKQTTVGTDGAIRTTTTQDDTREASLKGINLSSGTTTTNENIANGDVSSQSNKTTLSGGLTDPLTLKNTSTTTDKTADGTQQTSTSVGLTSGNGFGGVTGSASSSNVGPDGKQTDASVAAQAGVITNDKGTGVTGGINDLRIGGGNSSVSAGGYAAVDGSLQVLVSTAPDGSVTITLTATVHAKAGLFAGTRDPKEPATDGTQGSFGIGGGVVGNEVVTRSKKFSADEAQTQLAWLDSKASGVDERGHKTFGVDASEAVCTHLFGDSLANLAKKDATPKPGETFSDQTEAGGNLDVKGGVTGDNPGGRGGVNASISAEMLELKAREESALANGTLLKLMFGTRKSASVSAGMTEGSAGMGGGGSIMDQKTTTYAFSIPTEQPALLAEARALSSEEAVKKFAAEHPNLVAGTVDGHADSTGFNVNANVGPIGVGGGSTAAGNEDLAKGQRTDIGPDGKPVVVNTLSGTEDGSRTDNANVSLLNVKLAQGSDGAGSHGTSDTDGQASFDVLETKQESNAIGATEANLKAKGASDIALAAATGGGPMGAVKALAERVGETDTVGAHFDDAAFRALVGRAEDFATWMKAIGNQYREEWANLRKQLLNPVVPAEWIKQDQGSDNHLAATTLAQMKAFATFMKAAGPEGKKAVNILRGEYTGDAIGITVSLPPSLSDRTKEFAGLTSRVENMEKTLKPYAEVGDFATGNAMLLKLEGDLASMKDAIEKAPDHDSETLGVRAANGVADMIAKVEDFKQKYETACRAAVAKKSSLEVDDALKDHEKKSVGMIKDSDAAAKDAYAKTQAATSNEMNQKSDEERAKATQEANDAQAKADQARAAENAQRAQEATDAANKIIPDYEGRCGAVKGKCWQAADLVKHKPSADAIRSLQNLLREWDQEWVKLHQAYKDAKKFVRLDLRAGLPADMIADMRAVVGDKLGDWDVAEIDKIANQFTCFKWPARNDDDV
ncbi:MAG: hypothetical protein QM831_41585 [Kofleriaceae bacterium]